MASAKSRKAKAIRIVDYDVIWAKHRWSLHDIADYYGYSYNHVKDDLQHHPKFPKAMGRPPRWKKHQIEDFMEDLGKEFHKRGPKIEIVKEHTENRKAS